MERKITSGMRRRPGWRTVAAVVILGALLACGSARAQEGKPMAEQPALGVNRFGFDLFHQLTGKGLNQNIFISPVNVHVALTMALAGASGETLAAMTKVLGAQGQNAEAVVQAASDLNAAMNKAEAPNVIRSGNSIWARQGVRVRKDFIRLAQDRFGATASTLDFSDPKAAETINAWVREKTENKIDKLVEKIGSDTALYLISAIYFKGKWAEPFDAKNTKDQPFHLLGAPNNNPQKTVPMMSRSDSFLYLENPQFQAVTLPYSGNKLSMLILLPAQETDLKAFLSGLDAAKMDEWVRQMRRRRGELSLPRFRIEYAAELIAPLKAMGMGAAFDPRRASFDAMIEPPPSAFISEARHKTYVDVNEEGTEAAAATSVGISLTAVREPEAPFKMVVDRPFFCAIRDNTSGAMMFMGWIAEP